MEEEKDTSMVVLEEETENNGDTRGFQPEFPPGMAPKMLKLVKLINDMETKIGPLIAKPHHEILAKLKSAERAKIGLMELSTINMLFWILMKTSGENIDSALKDDYRIEVGRFKEAQGRLSEIEARPRRPRVDVRAAKRFINHGIGNNQRGDQEEEEEQPQPSIKQRLSGFPIEQSRDDAHSVSHDSGFQDQTDNSLLTPTPTKKTKKGKKSPIKGVAESPGVGKVLKKKKGKGLKKKKLTDATLQNDISEVVEMETGGNSNEASTVKKVKKKKKKLLSTSGDAATSANGQVKEEGIKKKKKKKLQQVAPTESNVEMEIGDKGTNGGNTREALPVKKKKKVHFINEDAEANANGQMNKGELKKKKKKKKVAQEGASSSQDVEMVVGDEGGNILANLSQTKGKDIASDVAAFLDTARGRINYEIENDDLTKGRSWYEKGWTS